VALPPPPVAQATARRSRARLWLILGLVGALVVALCGGGGGVAIWAIVSQLAPSQAGETVLLQDSLLGPSRPWPSQANQCEYVPTGYLVEGAWCVAAEGPFDAVDISVTLRPIAGAVGGSYGIVFRQREGQHGYLFDISPAGVWRFAKVSASVVAPDSPNVETFVWPTRDRNLHVGNAANTILVRAVGGHFTFYANNVRLGEATDTDSDRFDAGGIGLAASPGAEAVFSGLLVTRPR
jgi:hypothetical protein